MEKTSSRRHRVIAAKELLKDVVPWIDVDKKNKEEDPSEE